MPGAIATSITCGPQALLTVLMSIPWSSVQLLGPSTRDSGLSGNTSPPVLVVEPPEPAPPATWELLAACWTALNRVAAVRLPTVPLAGASP